MPYFYDIQRTTTTNGAANTESVHLAGKTVANQETVGVYGIIAAARSLTAGGGQVRIKDNTGTVFSGGTAQTPLPKNRRANPAAQSSWVNDATAVTLGTVLLVRGMAGIAQTGGTGGIQPIQQAAAIQMMPNTTNPVDVEIFSIAATASIAIDITAEIGEGI